MARQKAQEAPTIHPNALKFDLWHALGVLSWTTDHGDTAQRKLYDGIRHRVNHYLYRKIESVEQVREFIRKIEGLCEERPEVPSVPPSKSYYEALMERIFVPHAVTHEESASSASPYDSRTWEVLG